MATLSQTPQNSKAPRPEFRLGYRPELDGVRGISILLVLLLHFTPKLMPGGYFGVDIFFVLSGFLITSLLLQEWARKDSISLKDFYLRRTLRLGPALITYLALLGGYAFIFLKRESAAEIYTGILLTLSYVSNWVIALKRDLPLGILAITWSLAVEEQFYLIWPVLLVLFLKSKLDRRWILIALVIGVVCIGLHRRLLWEAGASIKRMYYATDTHADGLLLGCLAGCVVSWNLLPRSTLLVLGMKAMALISAVFLTYLTLSTRRDTPWLYAGGFSLVALAITLVLTILVWWPPALATTVLRFKPLVWIGRISYGLYLWHWPVRGFVFGRSTEPSIKQVIAAVILSFAITSLSFYFIEQPFLRWKKRFSHAVDGV
jgi:peptidoglycan/LPS O-acetylase OafA/YrhL